MNVARELGMAQLKLANKIRLDTQTRQLNPLPLGQTMLVQNQTGSKPTRWDRTRTVIETELTVPDIRLSRTGDFKNL